MLINLRNALMAGKRLPYDAEVEFLESTGTQWIDTGVPLKFPISADMTLAMVSPYGTLDSLPVFGFRYGGGGASSKFAIWFSKSQLRFALNYGSYDSGWKGSSVQGGQVVHLRTDGAKLYIDGSLVADGGAVTTSDASNTLALFQMRDTSSVAARGQCVRYYSCKIYDANDVLVRDYIPVRKGTVGYLYDRVSGKLFGNAGTGDFVLGPDVVPVEYILQTGTQYIDTLYPMADTRREVITVDWSGHSTTYREFMAGAASGSYLIEMSPTGYYGTAPTNLSSIQVSQKDRIRLDYTVGSRPSLYINDVFAINDTLIRVPVGNIMTGGIGTSGQNFPKMKIYGLDIFTDADEQVRKMIPVRVGTDATSWEGAMMDVLTRRIYRNAGTGAFTYGNDLRYPIPA